MGSSVMKHNPIKKISAKERKEKILELAGLIYDAYKDKGVKVDA
jgi:hypothetical protein